MPNSDLEIRISLGPRISAFGFISGICFHGGRDQAFAVRFVLATNSTVEKLPKNRVAVKHGSAKDSITACAGQSEDRVDERVAGEGKETFPYHKPWN
jgi:hypothetical protein